MADADPRAGKTYHVTWEQWETHCAERGIDPREQSEDGQDLGGGDSFSVICHEEPPEEYEEPAFSRIKSPRIQKKCSEWPLRSNSG